MASQLWTTSTNGLSLESLLSVDGGNEWSFENELSWAIGVGGLAQDIIEDNSRRKFSKIIE